MMFFATTVIALGLAAPGPLTLPQNFDRTVSMPATSSAGATYHETRDAAHLAQVLVANGAPRDLEVAEKVLDAVMACQELHQSDPHYGNFWWMREDGMVEDLNAVEFVLSHLIPMMVEHGDRLSPEMQKRVLQSIRLGIDEIARLDVLVAYTNICALDVANTCLAGELLKDPVIAKRGYEKLVKWIAFTDLNGCTYEFNSPTYTSVALDALHQLSELVKDADARIRARTFAARIALGVALHIHRATGRWAGPHSRAYYATTTCARPPEILDIQQKAKDGRLPAWIADVLDTTPAPLQVAESADPARDLGLRTYLSRSFALGVATKDFFDQTNCFIAHYVRPDQQRPGVIFSRYLMNDKWAGSNYYDPDRTPARELFEDGRFYGVQDGPRAIGLYTASSWGLCTSAKAALIFTGRDRIDEIWIGDERVRTLPAEVPRGGVVVVGSGGMLAAIRPLTITDMGRNAPIRLIERDGDLVLEMYNYLGPKKSFWEMEWPGGFYKGKPQCGFYAEFAQRSDYKDGKEFGRKVAGGVLKDDAKPPFTYEAVGERPWTVEYSRDGRTLGIQVDLMGWIVKRRWTQDGELPWPMLESAVARENRGGRVVVGDAVLECGKDAAWLYGSPARRLWVAGYHGLSPAPVTLTVPGGKVEIEAMGMGTIVWRDGTVTMEAVGLRGTPKVTGGRLRP
jgi:hypothetical protein